MRQGTVGITDLINVKERGSWDAFLLEFCEGISFGGGEVEGTIEDFDSALFEARGKLLGSHENFGCCHGSNGNEKWKEKRRRRSKGDSNKKASFPSGECGEVVFFLEKTSKKHPGQWVFFFLIKIHFKKKSNPGNDPKNAHSSSASVFFLSF